MGALSGDARSDGTAWPRPHFGAGGPPLSTTPTSRRHASRPRDLTEEQFDRLLGYSYRFAVILIGLVVAVVALQASRVIVMPVMLAVIVGLMFGSVADRLESRG